MKLQWAQSNNVPSLQDRDALFYVAALTFLWHYHVVHRGLLRPNRLGPIFKTWPDQSAHFDTQFSSFVIKNCFFSFLFFFHLICILFKKCLRQKSKHRSAFDDVFCIIPFYFSNLMYLPITIQGVIHKPCRHGSGINQMTLLPHKPY